MREPGLTHLTQFTSCAFSAFPHQRQCHLRQAGPNIFFSVIHLPLQLGGDGFPKQTENNAELVTREGRLPNPLGKKNQLPRQDEYSITSARIRFLYALAVSCQRFVNNIYLDSLVRFLGKIPSGEFVAAAVGAERGDFVGELLLRFEEKEDNKEKSKEDASAPCDSGTAKERKIMHDG